ncbi:hypothetical protein AB0B97_12105 [Micromonospora sp. NPDC049004]|uniref:WXG100-like domain-containing protein n=1 Tax=Micromonospora sp. NPDC049004 TaxID=3154348 RepID=UPI0033EA5ACA
MGDSKDGRPDPAALRQLANDWRAEGDRLELLGDNVLAAYNDVKWTGFASLSADIATNIVDLKLRKMKDAAHEFAKFLDEYADKVQEQIDKEKARTIIEIVLAILGILTMGLGAVLGPMLAALGRLLAGLLTAMSQVMGKIVTAVIDVAIGMLVWGSLQVAMEFGTTAVVSSIMGVPAEYTASIAISTVIAGVMGGLFSIRGVNNVPVKGSATGAKPGPIPSPAPTPKGGSSTDVTTNGTLVTGPKPYSNTTVDSSAVSIDGVGASATTIAPPVVPGGGRGAPVTGVGDQRVHSGAGSVGSAGRTVEHANPQAAPRTGETITTPATPMPQTTTAAPGGATPGKTLSAPPGPGKAGTFEVQTAPPGTVASRPPTVSGADTPPVANLDRGANLDRQPPRVSTGGEVPPLASVGGRSSVDLGQVSPLTPQPSRPGSVDLTISGHGDLTATPQPKTGFAGADVAASSVNTHGPGRTVTPDNRATGFAGGREAVTDVPATSTGGNVVNPATGRPDAAGTTFTPPHLGENVPAGAAPRSGAVNATPPAVPEHEAAAAGANAARGGSTAEGAATGQNRGLHYTTTSGPAAVPHGVNLPPAMRPGALPDLPAGTHVTAPPARVVGAEHLPSATPGRFPDAPVHDPGRGPAPVRDAVSSSTPGNTAGVNAGHGIAPPREAGTSAPGTARPGEVVPTRDIPAGTDAPRPAEASTTPRSSTDLTSTAASPRTGSPQRSTDVGSSTVRPVDSGPDASAARPADARTPAGRAGSGPHGSAPRPADVETPTGRPVGPSSRPDAAEVPTATPPRRSMSESPVSESSATARVDAGQGRSLEERFEALGGPGSKGSKGSDSASISGLEQRLEALGAGRSSMSHPDALKALRSEELQVPKTAPKEPELPEFPAVPTGTERQRALVEDFGEAAGLPRKEIDELLTNLKAKYGDSVLDKGADAAATRELIKDIGVRAGMDPSVARGFAERATSPNTATAQVSRAEFRAEIRAFADDNRMIERLVNLRVGRAEDLGVTMTQGPRRELTQALRAGDEAASAKISGDLDRAIEVRTTTAKATHDNAMENLERRVKELTQWRADREAIAASDAAAEKAAQQKFTQDFREGPLAELTYRVGAADGASPAKAMNLRSPAEPTRVEPPARQRHDDIVASEKEWAQYQRDPQGGEPELQLETPPHQREFDELLASADDLGAKAGLSPAEITQIRADIQARYRETLSLDEAKRTLLENTAVRAGMDPDRAATLAARDIDGGVGGGNARQVYGDELEQLAEGNHLIDRYVRLLDDDFRRFGLPFDDAARERLTLGLRQGDEAAIREVTDPLDEARTVADQRATRIQDQEQEDLEGRLEALGKPSERPASAAKVEPVEPTPTPAATRTPEELEALATVQEAFRRDVLPELHAGTTLKPSPGPRSEPSVSDRMGRTDEITDPEIRARDEEHQRQVQELTPPADVPELPVLPTVPTNGERLGSLQTFGKGLAEDAGLDDAATTQLLKTIEDRWGSSLLDDTSAAAARRTLVEEMYGRYDLTPNKVRTQDLVGGDAELRELARAGFRAELMSAQETKGLGDRLADLTMPNGYNLADDFVNSARSRLAEAYRSGDPDAAGQVHLEIAEKVSEITAKQHADELAARAIQQTEVNRGAFGKVMDDLTARLNAEDVKPLPGKQTRPESILPEGPGEGLLMAKPQPRDPNATPPTVSRADVPDDPPRRGTDSPTPVERAEQNIEDRNLAAAAAERDLHAAGLDPDSRFRAGVAEFRTANPEARFDVDAVRAEYDARIVDAWRDKPEADSWSPHVAAVASALPQIIAQAVTEGVPTATVDVDEPVVTVADAEFTVTLDALRDPESLPSAVRDLLRDRWIGDPARFARELEAAEMADDLLTRAVGVVDYDYGLDLPTSVLDGMRRTVIADVLHHHDVIRYQGDDARFAEDGGREAVWEAYEDRQFTSIKADVILARKAWMAAQSAAEQFHRLVGAGTTDALNLDLSEVSLRALGERFAAEQLALRGNHFYGLEDLQRQAFQERLDALLHPVDEIAALTDAERAKRWQQEASSLQAQYAQRLETARLAERHRPDLVADFDTVLAHAVAETERTGVATLDGLRPGVLDAFRADFVTTGRRWFEEVFGPAVTAGVHGYDALFVDAEAQWRHQYEHLRTSIRQEAFVHLQSHRHDAALDAAAANHRVVSAESGRDPLPESAYTMAREEFLAAAGAKLRATVKEQLDPFAKSQGAHWDTVAAEIERDIARYFDDEKLREYAARAATADADPSAPALPESAGTPGTAYDSAAAPILEAVRAGVSAALHRDGREVPADVRDRIAGEIEAVLREAGTAARARAERGGNTEIAVAAAVAELAERTAGLAQSVPARLLHHAQVGAELHHAERAFEGLLATRDALPSSVVATLSVAFAYEWLTRYDRLFRGATSQGEAAATETGLRDLAERVGIELPNHDLLSPAALRKALLDAAATLPGGSAAVGSGLLLRQPGAPPVNGMAMVADSFVPIPGEQRVIVAPGADVAGFLTEVTGRVTDPAQRAKIVVHAPTVPEAVLRTLGNRYGVTVAYTERPTDARQARRAVPVTADGTPTLQRWAEHWLVRPATQETPPPYGLRQGSRSGLFELPEGWVLEDLPQRVWARPAGSPDPELATRVRSGSDGGNASIVVGVPGVPVPEAVARAGLDLIERLPVEPGRQGVQWLSPLPEVQRPPVPMLQSAPELDATSGGLTGVPTVDTHAGPAHDALTTLRAAGYGDSAAAFLAEPDAAARDRILLDLLGAGDAVRGALPELHLGLANPDRSDVALAAVLGYAQTALRGEPVPADRVLGAANGLSVGTKSPLMNALLSLAGPASANRAVLASLAELVFDCR